MSFAKYTTVSEEKSRAEIEQTIRRHVGRDASFSYGTIPGKAAIQFSAYGRQVKFELPLPTEEEGFDKARDGRAPRSEPTSAQVEAWVDREYRRRWRCLLLIVKAKFEAVELEMELAGGEEEKARVFEREFLSRIVGAGGQTLYEAIQDMKVGGIRLLPPIDGNVVSIHEAKG
jgi:hypothetical protein